MERKELIMIFMDMKKDKIRMMDRSKEIGRIIDESGIIEEKVIEILMRRGIIENKVFEGEEWDKVIEKECNENGGGS